MRALVLLALCLAPAVALGPGCRTPGGPTVGVTESAFEAGVQPGVAEGSYTVIGWSELDPRAAMSTAMEKAHGYATKRDARAVPRRVEPGQGRDAFGREVFTVKLHFDLEAAPEAARGRGPHSAFEWRMRQRVEDGTLRIEDYERIMAAQPRPPE